MKLILAIIQPSKLEAVKEALSKVAVFRMTIVDVQGFGRQKGHTEVYRGHELTVNLLRKVQLQIAVNEDFVEPTVNAIMQAGRTGPEGRSGQVDGPSRALAGAAGQSAGLANTGLSLDRFAASRACAGRPDRGSAPATTFRRWLRFPCRYRHASGRTRGRLRPGVAAQQVRRGAAHRTARLVFQPLTLRPGSSVAVT